MNNEIIAFAHLGKVLTSIETRSNNQFSHYYDKLETGISQAKLNNPWFTEENILFAIQSIGKMLDADKLNQWIQPYDIKPALPKVIGVVMAGNIPLVGFHDFLCVLVSGHIFLGRLSSDDAKLLPALAGILKEIEPALSDKIKFTDGRLQNFDAIIATGSNNTARYFEYYFGKVPNIIRKNRNGVAVLTGEETSAELLALGSDIFMYFGLGCRSISKLFVPKGYLFDQLFKSIEDFHPIINHHKYKNNYDYYRSIFLINKVKHYDNGFLMITQDASYSSPPSVLYYEEYVEIEALKARLASDAEKIQCVVSQSDSLNGAILPGDVQKPELWDYADGIDTMQFLQGLFE
jgi:hypothetical protein